MNKTELVAALAEKAGISKKDADKALAAFLETVTDEMKKGEKIQLVGVGTFEVRERAATIKIPARKQAKFKAGKALKDAVSK